MTGSRNGHQNWINITLALLGFFIVAIILFGHFGNHQNVAQNVAAVATAPPSQSTERVQSVRVTNATVEAGPPPAIAVSGYAYDPISKAAPDKVTLLLDGQPVATLNAKAGKFSYLLPSGKMDAGQHDLRASFLSRDRLTIEVSRSKKIFVLGYSPKAPQNLLSRLHPGPATSLAVDAVVSGGARYRAASNIIKAYVPVGSPVLVTGWAIDSRATLDAGAVLAEIGDEAWVLADYGVERQDVAQTLHGPYRYSGFALRLSTAGLRPGTSYPIRIEVINSKKTTFFDVPTTIQLAIMSANFIPVQSPSLSVIDSINNSLAAPYANGNRPMLLQRSSKNVVRGWAGDAVNNALAREIDVVIDGRRVARATYDIYRPDVAAAEASPALVKSGFEATILPNTLPIGQHRLTIFIKGATGRTVRSREWIPIEVR